jgi:hypothetical protein
MRGLEFGIKIALSATSSVLHELPCYFVSLTLRLLKVGTIREGYMTIVIQWVLWRPLHHAAPDVHMPLTRKVSFTP